MQIQQTMQNSQHHKRAKINLIHDIQDITHKMEAFPVRTNVYHTSNIYWFKYCIRLMNIPIVNVVPGK